MIARSPNMPETLQHTVRSVVTLEGVGLFTGAAVRMTIQPASPGEGIRFRRMDLEGQPTIPARVEHVTDRPRRTVLKQGSATVETIEHAMAAFAALGIDNATIELDGPEVPAMDGSASAFVDAIGAAGLAEQDARRQYLVVTEPITVRDGDAMVAAYPPSEHELDLLYALDFGSGSPIRPQVYSYRVDPATFASEIAPARTFSSQHDAEAAWNRGMFRHLTPRDMLVIGEQGPIENVFRFDDEPVRHKMLDLLGDIALVGRPILGRVVAMRSGHALNHRLARELLECERAMQQRAGGIAQPPAMDIRTIMGLLPHRYPMILVDRVIELEGDARAVGIKNVTINEPFFQGHYPNVPIMPGVLIIEAMCQLAGLMLSQRLERTGKIAVLLSLDQVKLRKSVVPGDQLVMETEALRTSSRFGDVQARAFVGGDLAAEARVKFMMVDAERGR
jgi:UDP-3-O-[3-hydroxymyristoyl] N-acetylglucosamine deacetylase/3-hydroxyacyl-[acyl-carrier-protein] dehydratase